MHSDWLSSQKVNKCADRSKTNLNLFCKAKTVFLLSKVIQTNKNTLCMSSLDIIKTLYDI